MLPLEELILDLKVAYLEVDAQRPTLLCKLAKCRYDLFEDVIDGSNIGEADGGDR